MIKHYSYSGRRIFTIKNPKKQPGGLKAIQSLPVVYVNPAAPRVTGLRCTDAPKNCINSIVYAFFVNLIYLLLYLSLGTMALASPELSEGQQEFRSALQSGSNDRIQEFFEPGFASNELDTWKYQMQRGFLDFKASTVIPLSTDSLLIYIPTDSSPYSGENSDKYFDFIYRIYRVKPVTQPAATDSTTEFLITARCMEEFNPDFLTCKETLELFPSTKTMSIDSEITANLKFPWLIFKLAKEFKLQSLTINGKDHPYQRNKISWKMKSLHCWNGFTEYSKKIPAPISRLTLLSSINSWKRGF